MTLPSSGTISMSQINTEIQRGLNNPLSLNDGEARDLVSKYDIIKLSDFYGKAGVVANSITYSDPGDYTFYKPRYFNTLGVMLWGGGGSSGSHYSGGSTAFGGSGGWFYHARTNSKSAVNSSENLHVGHGGSGGGYAGSPGIFSSFGDFLYARGGHSGGGSYATRIDSAPVSVTMRSNWYFVASEIGGAGGYQPENSNNRSPGYWWTNWDGMNTIIAGAGGAAAMNDPYHGGRPYTSDFYGGKASSLAIGSSYYDSPPSSRYIVGLPSFFQNLAAGGYGAISSSGNGGGPTDGSFPYGKFPGGGGAGCDGASGSGVTFPGAQGAVHIYWY